MLTHAQQTIRVAARQSLRDALRTMPPSEIAGFISQAMREAGLEPELRVGIADRIGGIAWEDAR